MSCGSSRIPADVSAQPLNPGETPPFQQSIAHCPLRCITLCTDYSMNEDVDQGASSDAPPAGVENGNPEIEARPSIEQLLAQAESKLQEQRDAWLRAMADAENIRRRAQLGHQRYRGIERLPSH